MTDQAEKVERTQPHKHVPRCDDCGRRGVYHIKWDAYYCAHCNRWLEDGCGRPDCEFCANRPRKPDETKA